MSKILLKNGLILRQPPSSLAWSIGLYNTIVPNLVGYWSFNTDLTTDDSGNGKTLSNTSVTNPAGKYLNGASFNGSAYLYHSDDDAWDFGTGKFAVGGWFNWASSPSVSELITHGGNGGSNDTAGWTIAAEGSSRLDFLVYQNASTLLVNMGPTGLSLGTGVWHQIFVTRNDAGRIDIWLDGSSIANTTYGSTISYGTSELRFGVSWESNRYFSGKMDEMMIVKNETLTQENITELYNSGAGKYYGLSPNSASMIKNNFIPLPFTEWDSEMDEYKGTST